MNEEKLDILAIGAHPDDVEIGMGGTLAKYTNLGYKAAILNLTKAELSSNGTVEKRQEEAMLASSILGVNTTIQWSYPDRGLTLTAQQCIDSLVKVIRQYRPKLLFAPSKDDRHPDHVHCSNIVKEAHFNSGIHRYLPEEWQAYRPDQLYYYQINDIGNPDFIVDISEFMEVKMKALSAFESQFTIHEHSVSTPLNNNYLTKVKNREMLIGNKVGVEYGEGFTSDRPLLKSDLLGENV
ncbi:bacillithiol biosynthesis deacetylase BshB1 [Evansella halocellulosilytica]|uniref:bacillithiol biosynthesis deacetylase BshB1 n=1 Tax=Evansella halocellulosilytica TaxID=2011013 RepID=UPI000BB81CA2|nr:bacillithiol biosynthesis deacetylase BshB1 [Evansella halocellulosilytica]